MLEAVYVASRGQGIFFFLVDNELHTSISLLVDTASDLPSHERGALSLHVVEYQLCAIADEASDISPHE